MRAEGTSEGAQKGWDSRGRGRSEGKYPAEQPRRPTQMPPKMAKAFLEQLKKSNVKETGDPGMEWAKEHGQGPGMYVATDEDATEKDPTDSTEEDNGR